VALDVLIYQYLKPSGAHLSFPSRKQLISGAQPAQALVNPSACQVQCMRKSSLMTTAIIPRIRSKGANGEPVFHL
jgi:hypothetical protein